MILGREKHLSVHDDNQTYITFTAMQNIIKTTAIRNMINTGIEYLPTGRI